MVGWTLTKRYGWGVHADHDGRLALVGLGSPEYDRLSSDDSLRHLPALRTSRA